ncbi:hypothetical protein JMG10_08460 [Nostoc ellipsosporum NOK]|nr:hypothetical protein [Nostoc ellipsosporum NOK]
MQPGRAQDSLQVPKGVVVIKATEEQMEKARASLLRELKVTSASYQLFNGIAFIGPRLWGRYGTDANASRIQQGDMTIQVPQFTNGHRTGTKEMKGKVLQSPADFKTVWDILLRDLDGKEAKLRLPTTDELNYYWSIISFDIKSPVLVIETPGYNVLVDMSGTTGKVYWIEEV